MQFPTGIAIIIRLSKKPDYNDKEKTMPISHTEMCVCVACGKLFPVRMGDVITPAELFQLCPKCKLKKSILRVFRK